MSGPVVPAGKSSINTPVATFVDGVLDCQKYFVPSPRIKLNNMM